MMVITASYNQLKDVEAAMQNFNETKPTIYNKFLNIVKLTRRLQFGYQYMGSLLMDEVKLENADDYVMSVYQHEIEKLKTDSMFDDLKAFLADHKQLSYVNISKLALGESPKALVGPTIVR